MTWVFGKMEIKLTSSLWGLRFILTRKCQVTAILLVHKPSCVGAGAIYSVWESRQCTADITDPFVSGGSLSMLSGNLHDVLAT